MRLRCAYRNPTVARRQGVLVEEAYNLLGNTLHAEAVHGDDEAADKSLVEALHAFRFETCVRARSAAAA